MGFTQARLFGSLYMLIKDRLSSIYRHHFKIAELKIRRWVAGKTVWSRCGDALMPFTGDGDLQEYAYHKNGKEWYEGEEALLRNYINPGFVILDIGANMGFLTCVFSKLTGEHGKVIAFEPSSRVFRKLEMAISANNLKNTEAYNLGCGNENAERKLYSINPSSGHSTLVPNAQSAKFAPSETIKIVSVDEFLIRKCRRIDFIKIDTEGYEPQVILGASGIIHRDFPALYFEISGAYRESSIEAISLLRNMGYGFLPETDTRNIGPVANILALKR
jgi:FkbM family methyltransferase